MTVLAASVAAGSVSSNAVVPGVLGFLVVAGMGVALYFLFRSLNTQLRKVVPPHPGSAQAAAAAKAAAEAGSAREGTADRGNAGQARPIAAARARPGRRPADQDPR